VLYPTELRAHTVGKAQRLRALAARGFGTLAVQANSGPPARSLLMGKA